MTTFGFYHLTRLSLEDALAKLLVKTVQSGERALVRLGPNVDMEGLDRALWTFDDASFLPHGKAADARAPRQPVLLAKADACACGENPNGAGMLFLVDDPPVGPGTWRIEVSGTAGGRSWTAQASVAAPERCGRFGGVVPSGSTVRFDDEWASVVEEGDGLSGGGRALSSS